MTDVENSEMTLHEKKFLQNTDVFLQFMLLFVANLFCRDLCFLCGENFRPKLYMWRKMTNMARTTEYGILARYLYVRQDYSLEDMCKTLDVPEVGGY